MKHTRGKSTGPKSPEGKERSSQNSTAHGMRSNVVKLLPGESQEEMDALRAMWHSQYEKYLDGNDGLVSLLNSLADADWMQKRAMRLTSALMAQLVEAELNGEGEERTDKLEKKLMLWTRYKTSSENSFQRVWRAVEQFRSTRRRESLQQQNVVVKIHQVADQINSSRHRDGRFVSLEDLQERPDVPIGEQPGEAPDSGGGTREKRA